MVTDEDKAPNVLYVTSMGNKMISFCLMSKDMNAIGDISLSIVHVKSVFIDNRVMFLATETFKNLSIC